MAYGYYEGTIDGTVGPKMKHALGRFQADFNLKVTGTITPEVLDALKVASE
jgi:peptidoglycan hydrolase-like protein with peptidoglycan-binding domain